MFYHCFFLMISIHVGNDEIIFGDISLNTILYMMMTFRVILKMISY